jgi:hypothetical protein
MKHVHLLALIAGTSLLVSCADTPTARNTHRTERSEESERVTAEQSHSDQHGTPDEGQQNLWNAQRNVMNRDGNPVRGY